MLGSEGTAFSSAKLPKFTGYPTVQPNKQYRLSVGKGPITDLCMCVKSQELWFTPNNWHTHEIRQNIHLVFVAISFQL